MDIAGIWRNMRRNPNEAPRVGAHLEAAGDRISMNVSQECQVALPSANRVPEVSVTITSNRPGVAAQVTIAANLNSPDGSYQGPTKIVGQGQFTTNNSSVRTGFVVLPSGFSVVGVGAEALWADGAPHSLTLAYYQLECDPWVWWRWLIPLVDRLRLLSLSK